MMTELMPASAHDPAIVRAGAQANVHAKPLPLHAGMSAREVVHALLELAARRELAATRLW